MTRIRYLKTTLLATLVAGTLVSGCWHSTELAASWRDPSAQPIQFHRTIAVFVTKSETFRHTMEDKLAAAFPGGVPSYRVLGSSDVSDGVDVRRRLAEAGFDGAVIMRVANVDERVAYVPGSYWYGPPYYTFAGYWGTAWGYPYDPGYVTSEQVVSIETQIYSLKDDKLIFAARSETTNPSSVGKLEDSVIRHVKKRLEKDGLLLALLGCFDRSCNGTSSTQ